MYHSSVPSVHSHLSPLRHGLPVPRIVFSRLSAYFFFLVSSSVVCFEDGETIGVSLRCSGGVQCSCSSRTQRAFRRLLTGSDSLLPLAFLPSITITKNGTRIRLLRRPRLCWHPCRCPADSATAYNARSVISRVGSRWILPATRRAAQPAGQGRDADGGPHRRGWYVLSSLSSENEFRSRRWEIT